MSFAISQHEYAFFLRHIDLYGKARQASVLNHMAFDFYLRKGAVPPALQVLQQAVAEAPEGIKFNPWHDDLGRFTSGPGGGATPVSDSEQAPKSWGKPSTLAEHYEDHADDFAATSPEDYADQANQFLKRAQSEKLPGVQDKYGVQRYYDPASNTFGSYNPDGTTRTFYKPEAGAAYFQEQIDTDLSRGGRIINPLPEQSGGSGGGGSSDPFRLMHPGDPEIENE